MSERYRVCADAVVFRNGKRNFEVLCVQRKYPPHVGGWALPGGHVEPDERCKDAALRELSEETGLSQVRDVHEIGIFDEPRRDPRERVFSVGYVMWCEGGDEVKGGDDASAAKWFDVADLPKFAFDHDVMIKRGLKMLLEGFK